ncbi:hypothetical protein [Aeromicrobium sp. UC242_57]|uniref:hypothetical protein n=1 Tax=Aeromicrobium sp. UC242_57 TaxID=3374624 RepID=UPI0037B7B9B3
MRRCVAAVAVVLLFAVGACGGSDDSAPGEDVATSDANDVADSDDQAAAFDPCSEISADEVGTIIGATVTSEVGPFDVCEYDQEDPRATSVAIDTQPEAELGGGFEVYKSGSTSVLTDSQLHEIADIGDEAFAVTGRFGDGENTQLQAAALVDGVVITVNLTQASGLAADVLVDQATQLLRLAAAKA